MTTQPRNAFRTSAVALTSVLALGGGFLAACNPQPGERASTTTTTSMGHDHGDTDSTATVVLHSTMRTLWAERMQWTYDTVVAFASGSEALEPTMNRLLANQEQIGDAIRPVYGDEAGDA